MAQEQAAWWLQYLINEDLYIIEEKVPAEADDGVQEPAAYMHMESKAEAGRPKSEEREVLIAYARHQDPEKEAQDQVLLNNILKAIGKDQSNVHLLPIDGNNAIVSEVHLQQMPHTFAILFGPDIQYHVYRNERLYSVEKHGDSTVLQVDDLQTLAGFKLKKKALWEALQKLFKI